MQVSGNFWAVVGARGCGRHTLFKGLKQHLENDPDVVFITDSGSIESSPLLGCLNHIAKSGYHEDSPKAAQMGIFWARLSVIIQKEVAPLLQQGKTVIMLGFGGTVLTHALCGVTCETERRNLIALHEAFIRLSVLGLQVPPPHYLWLKVSAEAARSRIHMQTRRACETFGEYIEEMDQLYRLYGTVPGQTVTPVNADRTAAQVLMDALHVLENRQAIAA